MNGTVTVPRAKHARNTAFRPYFRRGLTSTAILRSPTPRLAMFDQKVSWAKAQNHTHFVYDFTEGCTARISIAEWDERSEPVPLKWTRGRAQRAVPLEYFDLTGDWSKLLGVKPAA